MRRQRKVTKTRAAGLPGREEQVDPGLRNAAVILTKAEAATGEAADEEEAGGKRLLEKPPGGQVLGRARGGRGAGQILSGAGGGVVTVLTWDKCKGFIF